MLPLIELVGKAIGSLWKRASMDHKAQAGNSVQTRGMTQKEEFESLLELHLTVLPQLILQMNTQES